MTPRVAASARAFQASVLVLLAACGRKGPPLPPLVRVPVAPAELSATRRGDTIALEFIVPSANTDGTRPANIERVEVYGFAGPDIKDEVLLKVRPKVASVAVKAPRDPDATVEPEDPAEEMEPPEGAGLDQGVRARLVVPLTAVSLAPVEAGNKKTKPRAADDDLPRPLVGPPTEVPSLTFVAVPFSTRGRMGRLSRRARVPLLPPPEPPSALAITYDETSMTVAWTPPAAKAQLLEPASGDVLPATLIGWSQPSIAYHVYDVPPGAPTAKPRAETRLTGTPVADPRYADSRFVWGAERCYEVRTVTLIDDLSVESDAAPPACVKPVDTFPPAAPKGLQVVASERAINLIWQPNEEKDLAGYIVLRGAAANALEPITPSPVADAAFPDAVPSGAHYFYAVKAVDKAGNASGPSNVRDATAR